jgi:hypothetical protein
VIGASNKDTAMSQPTVDELKRVLSARHARQHGAAPTHRAARPRGRARATTNRREVEQLLRSFFAKSGLDVAKLDQMLRGIQRDERDAFETLAAEDATHVDSDRQTLRYQIEGRQKAFEAINAHPIGGHFASTRIVLDKPFLIWQTPRPNLNEFIDSHYESLNSSVKIKIDTNTGSDITLFSFYFFWVNDGDFAAGVNVDSSLILNGICEVEAATGFFSGDRCGLSLSAQLTLLEWWNQPDGQPTQPLPQNSQFKTLASLDASGGGIFSSPDFKSRIFSFESADVSFDAFLIPAHSGAVFEVSVGVSYAFTDGGEDIADLILVDFADNAAGRFISCPSVNLELLTAPPGVIANA